MKKFHCEIKGQHKYVDYDATSFVKLSCQPNKAEGIGFKYHMRLNSYRKKANIIISYLELQYVKQTKF